jgi:hypothetical protein
MPTQAASTRGVAERCTAPRATDGLDGENDVVASKEQGSSVVLLHPTVGPVHAKRYNETR